MSGISAGGEEFTSDMARIEAALDRIAKVSVSALAPAKVASADITMVAERLDQLIARLRSTLNEP